MHFLPILQRLMPFLRWPRPTVQSLTRDAWAGISVGLVLVPQAVAYASLAGMPPETGLYAALIPSIVGVLWGSSALLAVGPVALTSLLVFGSLSPLASPGSATWVALAIWLSVYSGLIQVAMGVFRLGRIVSLVSQPVITGFINAAAIIIIFSQLPALLGSTTLFSEHASVIVGRLLSPPPQMALEATFGLSALLLLILSKRLFPAFPAVLFVTLLGIVASWWIGYAELGGAIVGTLPSGLPPLVLPPSIPLQSHQELWPAALVLALISFTEAMSSCRVLARKKNEPWNENQELLGQGLAKVASAFNGAFPVSGSFSRSALNLYAGATSAWSTLFSALCVLVTLLFLTDVIYFLPRSVLAAMIMVPVFGLIDLPAFRRLLSISKWDAGIAAVTFAVTLVSVPRLHWGVLAGVALTMSLFLYRRTQPRIIEVSQHEDGTFRDRSRFDLPALAPDLLAVRMDAALIFLTATALERFINERCRASTQVKRVLLCAGAINDIDASGVISLEQIWANLRSEGITLYLSGVKKQVWDPLDSAGLIDTIGRKNIFATDAQAINVLRSAST